MPKKYDNNPVLCFISSTKIGVIDIKPDNLSYVVSRLTSSINLDLVALLKFQHNGGIGK